MQDLDKILLGRIQVDGIARRPFGDRVLIRAFRRQIAEDRVSPPAWITLDGFLGNEAGIGRVFIRTQIKSALIVAGDEEDIVARLRWQKPTKQSVPVIAANSVRAVGRILKERLEGPVSWAVGVIEIG